MPDLTNSQSWNRYSYTLNNPVKYIDPSGHRYCDLDGLECEDHGDDGFYGTDNDWKPGTWSYGGGGKGGDPSCTPGDDCFDQLKEFLANAAGFAPGLETIDDGLTAFTGCGIACQYGYEDQVGWGWRVAFGLALFVPGGSGKLIYEPAMDLIKWGKYELHHLIPKAVSNSGIVRLAAEAGFDFDKYRIPLPNNMEMADLVNVPWHKGSHPNYNAFVEDQLDQISTIASKENWSPYDAATYLESFVTELAKIITNSGTGKLP